MHVCLPLYSLLCDTKSCAILIQARCARRWARKSPEGGLVKVRLQGEFTDSLIDSDHWESESCSHTRSSQTW